MAIQQHTFISIITTLYNRANTTLRLLDSILPFLDKDDELIVVDDGSTDGGGDVVREAFQNRPNCHLLTQTNKGLIHAFNRCLDEAKGEYVLNVDGDDYLIGDSLVIIREVLKRHHPDILHFGYKERFSDGTITEHPNFPEDCVFASKTDIVSSPVFRSRAGSALSSYTRKAIKRSIIGDIRLLPPTQGSDNVFIRQVFAKANSFVAITNMCYCVSISEGSISRSPHTPSYYYESLQRALDSIPFFIENSSQSHYPLVEACFIFYQYRDYCIYSLSHHSFDSSFAKKASKIIRKNKSMIIPKGPIRTRFLNFLFLRMPRIAVFLKSHRKKTKERKLSKGEYAF